VGVEPINSGIGRGTASRFSLLSSLISWVPAKGSAITAKK